MSAGFNRDTAPGFLLTFYIVVIGAIVFHEAITFPVIIGSILVITASVITVLPDLIKSKQKA